MKIYASKNYENLSYMVRDESVLIRILETEVIYSSRPEFSSDSRFVSLSRNLTSQAKRNPKRWKYGVILDGSKLTEKYKVVPYSYAGNAFNSKRSTFRVKTITKYDTGQHTLTLVNFPTIDISEDLYDEIVDLIKADAQGLNEKKKLKYKVGTRRVSGRVITDQYTYDVPSGGLVLDNKISENLQSMLAHHTALNETEERLYTTSNLVDISGCIVGIVVPKDEKLSNSLVQLCQVMQLSILEY